MIKFSSKKSDNIVNGKTIYSENDRGFDFIPKIEVDINIAIAYINLGFDSENMKGQLVWGFSPSESWIAMSDKPPVSFTGELLLLGECESGETWRLDKDEMWNTHHNSKTGWFCIGDTSQEIDDTNVEFATDIIAVLQSDTLKALWFKSDFIE